MMFSSYTPTPAYRIFLKSLIQTRLDRGFSQTQLAEYLGLTSAQVASYEAGAVPLGFIDVRSWLLALDMPFVQFTTQMEEVLDSTLTHDETIAPPSVPQSLEPQSHDPTPEPPRSRVIDDALLAKFDAWPTYRAFLDRLKEARLQAGLSLEQMAEHFDIDHEIAVGFEDGTAPVDFLIVRKWCKVFNAPGATFADFLALYHEEMERIEAVERGIPNEHEAPALTLPPLSAPTPTVVPEIPTVKTPTIQVLFFAPGQPPEVRTVENTPEALQTLVEGPTTPLDIGIPGTIVVANASAKDRALPANRKILPAGTHGPTDIHLHGPFLVAGNEDPCMRSLTPLELELVLDYLAPELSPSRFNGLMATLEGGTQWMENWD